MRWTFLSLLILISSPGCENPRVTEVEELKGQTLKQVKDSLGVPTQENQYPLEQAVGELRAPLQNSYPLTVPSNRKVRIRELIWKNGEYYTSVWAHQVEGEWLVLEACRWHEKVQF